MNQNKILQEEAGREVEVKTSPLDVETVLVDGIKGIAVTPSSIRISFIENVLDTNSLDDATGPIKGRHVINLSMEHGSFLAVMDLLMRVREDIVGTSND